MNVVIVCIGLETHHYTVKFCNASRSGRVVLAQPVCGYPVSAKWVRYRWGHSVVGGIVNDGGGRCSLRRIANTRQMDERKRFVWLQSAVKTTNSAESDVCFTVVWFMALYLNDLFKIFMFIIFFFKLTRNRYQNNLSCRT